MFLDEYDYETDIAVKQEEAKEEGFAEGVQQKAIETAIAFLNEGDSPEKITRCTKLPLDKVLELQKQIDEKKMKECNFSRSVTLKPGAKDFLEDASWKEDFMNGRRNVE